MRLIPVAVLEPRLRLVKDGEVVDGPAFDIESLFAEHRVPSNPRKASPAMRERVLASFEASSRHDNRFNGVGDPGVYYAGTTLPAAIQEIRWHLEHDAGIPFDETRVYRAVTARVDGRFLDLRGTRAKALNPDPAIGYAAGRKVALDARGVCDGIIYPSARDPEGTCIAVFDPACIHDIRLDRTLSFEPLPGTERKWGYRLHAQPHQLHRGSRLEMA